VIVQLGRAQILLSQHSKCVRTILHCSLPSCHSLKELTMTTGGTSIDPPGRGNARLRRGWHTENLRRGRQSRERVRLRHASSTSRTGNTEVRELDTGDWHAAAQGRVGYVRELYQSICFHCVTNSAPPARCTAGRPSPRSLRSSKPGMTVGITVILESQAGEATSWKSWDEK